MVKIYLERENKTKEIEFEGKLKKLLKKLKIKREEVIIIRNNKVITDNTKIKQEDKLEFLSVLSGG